MGDKNPWRICPSCEGHGVSSAYLGVLTQERLAELGADWAEDYRNGIFDRQCRYCDGTGKVRESRIAAIPRSHS